MSKFKPGDTVFIGKHRADVLVEVKPTRFKKIPRYLVESWVDQRGRFIIKETKMYKDNL